MISRSIIVFIFLAILTFFAMVTESSLSSHFNDPAINVLVRTEGGFDDLTAGRIGDTLFEDEEMMMPTESARATLGNKAYSGYDALSKNKIPCDRRGESYYACTRMQKRTIFS
ncbi:hypothetical protein P3S68_005067 [Capsicum galapagoense]